MLIDGCPCALLRLNLTFQDSIIQACAHSDGLKRIVLSIEVILIQREHLLISRPNLVEAPSANHFDFSASVLTLRLIISLTLLNSLE